MVSNDGERVAAKAKHHTHTHELNINMSTHILPSTKLFITLCIFSFLFSTFFFFFSFLHLLLFVFPLVNRCQCHALASSALDSHHTRTHLKRVMQFSFWLDFHTVSVGRRTNETIASQFSHFCTSNQIIFSQKFAERAPIGLIKTKLSFRNWESWEAGMAWHGFAMQFQWKAIEIKNARQGEMDAWMGRSDDQLSCDIRFIDFHSLGGQLPRETNVFE